jgi:hypothetical protein
MEKNAWGASQTNTYLVTWLTNYDLACAIIRAESQKNALKIAIAVGAWPESIEIHCVPENVIEGVTAVAHFDGMILGSDKIDREQIK